MRIDLHTHTSPRSACSSLDPLDLVREATRLGLDGICLTEHQVLWQPDEIAELAQATQLEVFRGNEFTTNQGDILVFGYEEDVKELLTIEELRDAVTAAGGFMIAAHPFRGFKTFGIGQLQMTVEQACNRKVFDFVDALEIRNGKVSDQENDMAARVAARLGLSGTAGSDAHRMDEVGKWVTDFERAIENEQELIEELRAGRFTAADASGRE
jgi:histidinol phosphatase-like PHP family hydrolase